MAFEVRTCPRCNGARWIYNPLTKRHDIRCDLCKGRGTIIISTYP